MFDRFGLWIEVVGLAVGRAGVVASDDAIEVMRFWFSAASGKIDGLTLASAFMVVKALPQDTDVLVTVRLNLAD